MFIDVIPRTPAKWVGVLAWTDTLTALYGLQIGPMLVSQYTLIGSVLIDPSAPTGFAAMYSLARATAFACDGRSCAPASAAASAVRWSCRLAYQPKPRSIESAAMPMITKTARTMRMRVWPRSGCISDDRTFVP